MNGRARWYLSLAAPVDGARVGHRAAQQLIKARRVGRRHRRVQRAGEIARRPGKRQIGVHPGEAPARAASQRKIAAVGLLIQRQRGGAFGRRRRQEATLSGIAARGR